MKIPKEMCIMPGDVLITRAQEMLTDIMLEYGVMAQMELNYRTVSIWNDVSKDFTYRHEIDTIQFNVMDHTFETIKDLRTALNNKAFL